MVIDVSGYLLAKERGATPLMALKWKNLEELHTKRLWHQLTVALQELVKEPELQRNKQLIELYENCLKEFELRINKQSFMELCSLIVTQYDKPADAYAFLDHCEAQVKSDLVALALCKVTRGQIKLEKEKNLADVKTILGEVDDIFVQYDGISKVHGPFYLLQSKFYLGQGDLTAYYRSAIKFLGCTPLEQMPIEEQREYAKNLAISSLVADGMYNFGELLAHPVLNSLIRTPEEWLLNLVKAFNAGDVTEFQNLKKRWITNKMLADNQKKLEEKIVLCAIMETTFQRAANARQLTFKDIAKVTKVEEENVELFVMKAFSKELVKGKIDNVGQKVFMTWVQPRVLAKDQIGTMVDRIGDWQTVLVKAEEMMKRNTVEILDD